MQVLKNVSLLCATLTTLAACGGGGGGPEPVSCGTSTASISIDGTVTFDKVPHNGPALDYTFIPNAPARGVTVQALDGNNEAVVLATTKTDATGHYNMNVPDNTYIKMRVLAEMVQPGSPAWTMQVRDNTNSNALYAMDGNRACTTTADETRDLNAPSGWGGTSYTGARTAAAFAILDPIYDGIQLLLTANPSLVFPPLNFYWSGNNSSVNGNPALGEIGSTHFNGSNGIYLLGEQDVDTDEYDPSVIAHEWGHYVEVSFSRSDNIGGPHFTGDRLDMRVAFGEGFANAFSGMVLNNPEYLDANDTQQSNGFGFNMETEVVPTSPPAPTDLRGWYNESSIEKVVYDVYDSNDDAPDNDTLSLGFKPIWDVLVNEQRTESALTSIFKFISPLKSRNPGAVTQINQILSGDNANNPSSTLGQNIHVFDVYGSSESNSASNSNILPIYTVLTPTQPANNICVTRAIAFDTHSGTLAYNLLGMSRFVRFTPTVSGVYQIKVQGDAGADPDVSFIYADGSASVYENPGESETLTETLTANQEYIIEIYDNNLLIEASAQRIHCNDVSVISTP